MKRKIDSLSHTSYFKDEVCENQLKTYKLNSLLNEQKQEEKTIQSDNSNLKFSFGHTFNNTNENNSTMDNWKQPITVQSFQGQQMSGSFTKEVVEFNRPTAPQGIIRTGTMKRIIPNQTDDENFKRFMENFEEF